MCINSKMGEKTCVVQLLPRNEERGSVLESVGVCQGMLCVLTLWV